MKHIIITLFIFIFYHLSNPAVLVHNSKKEIDACKGQLNLKLIRIWGGGDEKDERIFFETPTDMVIDKNNLVYICDRHDHCVKVFKSDQEYVRTIGRKGQGPGDLLGPGKVALAPNGDLLVFEYDGFRLQRFSPEGYSKSIIKINKAIGWAGITSKNELTLSNWLHTFLSKKIIAFINETGKVTRDFGHHDDPFSNYIDSEKLMIAMDDSDHFYVANRWTPVIRKYTPEGELQIAITFETPFPVQDQVKLNSTKTEIEIIRTDKGPQSSFKKDSSGNVMIRKRGKPKINIFNGIGIDAENRIYVVTAQRRLSEEENLATRISGGIDGINRKLVDFEIVENIDLYQLLVFSQDGKICAQARFKGMCDDIYIHNDRLFIIDGLINQRILEFEMTFNNGSLNP
jgi:hypothetical protein